jgi:hypothetical protein
MIRRIASLLPALLLCAGVQAATVNTTLTVNATGSIGLSITATGTATLTNIGNGTFSATLSLTPDASGNLSAPFTITLTNGDKINGTIKFSASLLTGSGTGSATITGGTGAYAGATGTFPNLTGTGSVGASITVNFSGAGTINTGGDAGPPVPTVTAVLDAASNTAGIAQGSIFIVKGSNLSASGFTSFAPPRPQQSAGVKVTFTPTSGGTGVGPGVIRYVRSGTAGV